ELSQPGRDQHRLWRRDRLHRYPPDLPERHPLGVAPERRPDPRTDLSGLHGRDRERLRNGSEFPLELLDHPPPQPDPRANLGLDLRPADNPRPGAPTIAPEPLSLSGPPEARACLLVLRRGKVQQQVPSLRARLFRRGPQGRTTSGPRGQRQHPPPTNPSSRSAHEFGAGKGTVLKFTAGMHPDLGVAKPHYEEQEV